MALNLTRQATKLLPLDPGYLNVIFITGSLLLSENIVYAFCPLEFDLLGLKIDAPTAEL